MARRRRVSNPEIQDLIDEANRSVRDSPEAVDAAFRKYRKHYLEATKMAAILKKDGWRKHPGLKEALEAAKEDLREADKFIFKYVSGKAKDLRKRLERLKKSPDARARNREGIRQAENAVQRIEKSVDLPNKDPRPSIREAEGIIQGIESGAGPSELFQTPKGRISKKEQSANERKISKVIDGWIARGTGLRGHIAKDKTLKERGSDVYSKEYGFGRVVSTDGRRADVSFEEVGIVTVAIGEIVPEELEMLDRDIALATRKRGGPDSGDVQRIMNRYKRLRAHWQKASSARDYASAKRALDRFVVDMRKAIEDGSLDNEKIDSMMMKLEKISLIDSKAKADWSKQELRQWASDVSRARKALSKLKRKKNPCVGFHFHGKDADSILKAIEASNSRQRKSNPSKRSGPLAKDMIAQCRKHWEAYCKRPNKTNLRKCKKYLMEDMKGSKFKTVQAERARAMRAVNREAKTIGL